jgi:hypothetical protein
VLYSLIGASIYFAVTQMFPQKSIFFQDLIVTYQKAPKGGLSVFYTVPAEDLDNPVPIPVNPVSML